jgi:hypothetical protein
VGLQAGGIFDLVAVAGSILAVWFGCCLDYARVGLECSWHCSGTVAVVGTVPSVCCWLVVAGGILFFLHLFLFHPWEVAAVE